VNALHALRHAAQNLQCTVFDQTPSRFLNLQNGSFGFKCELYVGNITAAVIGVLRPTPFEGEFNRKLILSKLKFGNFPLNFNIIINLLLDKVQSSRILTANHRFRLSAIVY